MGVAGLADEGVSRLEVEALTVEDAFAVAFENEVELFVAVVKVLADDGMRLELEAAYELYIALAVLGQVLEHPGLALAAPDVLSVYRNPGVRALVLTLAG